mmetsp:Transcript_83100/g.214104  ORF Transcript_83100/g.214104 Transcript_83100/m.214104 type:complete len:201 (-) Transcript_83100:11-613(-)
MRSSGRHLEAHSQIYSGHRRRACIWKTGCASDAHPMSTTSSPSTLSTPHADELQVKLPTHLRDHAAGELLRRELAVREQPRLLEDADEPGLRAPQLVGRQLVQRAGLRAEHQRRRAVLGAPTWSSRERVDLVERVLRSVGPPQGVGIRPARQPRKDADHAFDLLFEERPDRVSRSDVPRGRRSWRAVCRYRTGGFACCCK